jgi:hypothetical protein
MIGAIGSKQVDFDFFKGKSLVGDRFLLLILKDLGKEKGQEEICGNYTARSTYHWLFNDRDL